MPARYLDRLQIFQIEEANYSFLEKLQLAHLPTVSFESFDIRQGRKIILDDENLFNKNGPIESLN